MNRNPLVDENGEHLVSSSPGDERFLNERRIVVVSELKAPLDLPSNVEGGVYMKNANSSKGVSRALFSGDMQHNSTSIVASTEFEFTNVSDNNKSCKNQVAMVNYRSEFVSRDAEVEGRSFNIELESSSVGTCEKDVQQDAATVSKTHNDFLSNLLSVSEDDQTCFFRQIRSGFRLSLQNIHVGKTSISNNISSVPAVLTTQPIYRMPTVNFIDPTSAIQNQGQSSVPATSPSRRRAWNRENIKPRISHLKIFEKFNAIFQERYGSALEKIHYRDPWTNDVKIIEKLPIRTTLTSPLILDAIDWHEEPLCHVYIAACYSMDHYKEKVRPSLRAFVNQIDGAASGNELDVISAASFAAKKEYGAKKNSDNKRVQVDAASRAVAAAKDATCSITSSHYMIIFVPINPSSIEMEVSLADDISKDNGVGLRGRIAAAARRTHPKDPSDDETNVDQNKDDETYTNQIILLSKEHREIYKKIRTDFERGRTSILSTLLDSENNVLEETPIQNQEFHTTMQELSKILVSGFYDRIRKYTEELNRYSATEFSWHQPYTPFHWSRFILLKESLSFSFEQMQLPNEAAREYEEIASSLPLGYLATRPKHLSGIYDRAAASDSLAFRLFLKNCINSTEDLHDICMLYISSRQAHLLFLYGDPIQAVSRLYNYVQHSYTLRRQLINSCDSTEDTKRLNVENEMWALSLCWDIKSASEMLYIPFLDKDVPSAVDVTSLVEHVARPLIHLMCDLLEFARARAEQVNQNLFSSKNLINASLIEKLHHYDFMWLRWDSLELPDDLRPLPSKKSDPRKISELDDDKMMNPFILDIYKSQEKFQHFILDIYRNLLTVNNFLGRHRYASRVLTDLADISISLNEIQVGMDYLLSIIDKLSVESWDRILVWVAFRLLTCQRLLKERSDYFKTLTKILSHGLAKSMPQNVKYVLLMDVSDLVQCMDPNESAWGFAPLFDVHARVPEMNYDSGVVYQKCKEGEIVCANVDLRSELVQSIEVDQISLLLLKSEQYYNKRKSKGNLHESESSESESSTIFKAEKSIILYPGKNTISFPWVATNVGNYIISSMHFRWGRATFHHEFMVNTNEVVLGFIVEQKKTKKSSSVDSSLFIPGITDDATSSLKSGDNSIIVREHMHFQGEELHFGAPIISAEKSASYSEPSVLVADNVVIHHLNSDESIINVSVICNSPTRLHLKSACITLPECLVLSQNGDVSQNLIPKSVAQGDDFFITFRCIRSCSLKHPNHERGTCHAFINFELHHEYSRQVPQVIKINTSSICSENDRYDGDIMNARLSCIQEEGSVGEPVHFKYTLSNFESLSKAKSFSSISYCLTSECETWIIAGATKGSISLIPDENKYDLDFVAIPTKCGRIERFPSLQLAMENNRAIKINATLPVSFQCHPLSTVDELAYTPARGIK